MENRSFDEERRTTTYRLNSWLSLFKVIQTWTYLCLPDAEPKFGVQNGIINESDAGNSDLWNGVCKEVLDSNLTSQLQTGHRSKTDSRPSCIIEWSEHWSKLERDMPCHIPESERYDMNCRFQNDNTEFAQFLEQMESFFRQKKANDLAKISFLKHLQRLPMDSKKKSCVHLLNNLCKTAINGVKHMVLMVISLYKPWKN